YTEKYEKAFLEDAETLNIERPQLVRATDHIQDMAKSIALLEKKGFAYRADDGSYYFRIAKFPDYGKLSKKDFAGMEDGARVDVDEPGQLLYPARLGAQGSQTVVDPLPAGIGSLPKSAQLYV